MDNTFQLHPCDLDIPCQSFQCYERAAFYLGKKDAPRGTETIICQKCADELIDSIIKTKGSIEINGDPLPLSDETFFSMKELKEQAKALGIHYVGVKKEDLIQKIRDASK